MKDPKKQITVLSALFILGICFATLFPQTAAADLSLTLAAPKNTYNTGETLPLYLTAHNSGGAETVDFYFGFMDSAYTIYTNGPTGWGLGLKPWLPNLVLPAGFDLPATEFMKITLPSQAPPVTTAGTNYFFSFLSDAALDFKSLSIFTFTYVDLQYLVGSWKSTPRYFGDLSSKITYGFALYQGQPRFTMAGEVYAVGIDLFYGTYALGNSGLLTYTVEYECLQWPEGGWYLCEDPYIKLVTTPEIHTVPYAINRVKGLGYEILQTSTDKNVTQQGWYARGLDYTKDASAIGQLAGMWRCMGCSFPYYYQMLIYRSGSSYRFHWAQDVSYNGVYSGIYYYGGTAEVKGGKLILKPDIVYVCPSTVYQYPTEKFFVEPGFLANSPFYDLTNAQWEIPFVSQANADGTTTMQLDLGQILVLTRLAN
jgi:hypothetical protein